MKRPFAPLHPAPALVFALLLGALAICGCGRRQPGDLLLITVDTLRADHLGIYGYARDTSPEIDAFFGDAAIFERAYATSAYTSASTASLLTGKLPQEHGVRLFDQIFPAQAPLLPQILPEIYETAAFISTRVLSDDGTGMADRFDHFDDHIERRVDVGLRERAAGPTTDAVLAWLQQRERAEPARPLFLWVHYKDPHAPYRPPDGRSHGFRSEAASGLDSSRVPPYVRLDGVKDPIEYIDRYDDEIAYADAEIGRLLRGFARLRSLEDALIVFTADHGETLVERHQWFDHAYHVFEEIVRVPLMLRGPGVPAGRFRALSSGIDVAPTLLRFAGAEVPAELAGHDLREAGALPDPRTIFVESARGLAGHQWRAALRGERKWMVKVRADGVPDRRVYDLGRDPGELRPGAWVETDPTAQSLLDLIERDPDPAGRPENPERGQLSEELLRRLGYVR